VFGDPRSGLPGKPEQPTGLAAVSEPGGRDPADRRVPGQEVAVRDRSARQRIDGLACPLETKSITIDVVFDIGFVPTDEGLRSVDHRETVRDHAGHDTTADLREIQIRFVSGLSL